MVAHKLILFASAIALLSCTHASKKDAGLEKTPAIGLGAPATEAEIAGWNIDVRPDGQNLPPGHGSVPMGLKVYTNQCLSCHGAKLEGGIGPALVGGEGTLATMKPLKTLGSYWPYSTTIFDYIRRSMPFQAPQSMTNEDVYAVTAYLLHMNKLLPADADLDAKMLVAVQMPNRNGFYVDDRPDAKNARCMSNCVKK